jgi:hypothetical protein
VWVGVGSDGVWALFWVMLPLVLGLASAAVAVFSLAKIAPGPLQEGSTTNYFWAGIALIVIAGYLATVATTSLFAYAARRRGAPGR